MPRNFNNGRLVTVTIGGFPGLRYGFYTRVRNATSTALGHVTVNPVGIADVTGIVIGANSPKPPRASKKQAVGFEGSFADSAKIPELKADGWRITRGKRRRGSSSPRSQTVYIPINGVNYAWNRAESAEVPEGLDQAGHEIPGNNTPLVFGARFPKPSRMKADVASGEYSTFIAPGNTVADNLKAVGWSPAGDGVYTTQDFKDVA